MKLIKLQTVSVNTISFDYCPHSTYTYSMHNVQLNGLMIIESFLCIHNTTYITQHNEMLFTIDAYLYS